VDFSVVNCAYRTGVFANTTGTVLRGYFHGPTDQEGLVFSGSTTTLLFQCCDMDYIAPSAYPSVSIWCINSGNPVFGETGTPIVNNRITDNGQYLVRFSGTGAKPTLAGRQNILDQNYSGGTPKYIKWDTPYGGTYQATEIYWGSMTPAIQFFDPAYPLLWNYSRYLVNDPGLCGGEREFSGFESAFDSALALEASGEWEEAQAVHLAIAENSEYAIGDRVASAARAMAANRETGALSGSDVEALSDDMNSATAELADSLAVARVELCFKTDQADYAGALGGYEDLLDWGLSPEDSLLTVIDVYHVQMLAGSGGGHLDAALEPRHTEYAVHSTAEGVRKVDAAMAALVGRGGEPREEPSVPTAYALYQNYPNPFNPITEIRFDLPENAKVELRVFNTLGQLVTTLVNEERQAGVYRVLWDGKSIVGQPVAAGLYVCQIRAGKFTDSKKMVLLK